MRDTDSDWNEIAKTEPYWKVLSHEEFKSPTEDALARFFLTGEHDVGYTATIFEKHFGDFSPNSALDFGCGVGRLTCAMQKYAKRIVGVDIAETMRTISSANMKKRGIIDFEILAEIPTEEHFDWVNSVIVLQHIPPIRGYKLIEKLWDVVCPGGYFSIQLTLYHDINNLENRFNGISSFQYDGETIHAKVGTSKDDAGTMMLFDYDFNVLMSILNLGDRQPMYLEHTNHGGHRWVWIFLKKLTKELIA
jgi:SAM-dependent methyltransferase